jgi:hypothetical protein
VRPQPLELVTGEEKQVERGGRTCFATVMGSPTHAALSFMEALASTVLLPALPFLAGKCPHARSNMPLCIPLLTRACALIHNTDKYMREDSVTLGLLLIAGMFFLGRLITTFWWFFRHSSAHPSAKGEMVGMADVIKIGLSYLVVLVTMGFVDEFWVLLAGQLALGMITGRYVRRPATQLRSCIHLEPGACTASRRRRGARPWRSCWVPSPGR